MLRNWCERRTALSLVVLSTGSSMERLSGVTADILQVGAKKVFFGLGSETRGFELAGVSFSVGTSPDSLEITFPTGDRLLFIERKPD